ncbi:M50 family metallopeptidase [Tsukamurella sp. 8F]|uniref:M50 family metallopeptidase n=1 Tax=unclassified Tsukamurella TaxID=2633480 RepID=UPI0023B9F536|nr:MULTISPECIES: M50 family metallopeptidase [unclassified Tsukamurella]MDF0531580.1 M50 family metallopeptidase [Tsukamurella sp. 8J]MDF0587573.1 M50 family metallopeptidase [Tsukamurella sp. 8F]
MLYVLGIVVFALCILGSVAWHECGHMWAAQATGMKVRRYFVGFGPTLWSTRRGGIEYGVKAIPLGGFCDIAGMTLLDEIAPEDREKAMYRQAAWKRIFVLFAGPGMNFILGGFLIFIVACIWGLPAIGQPGHAAVAGTQCVTATSTKPAQGQPSKGIGPCIGNPAADAGMRFGDVIAAVNGTPVDASTVTTALQSTSGPIRLTIERDGAQRDVTVTPVTSQKWQPAPNGKDLVEVTGPTIGISVGELGVINHYNPITAVGGAAVFTGQIGKQTVIAIGHLPERVPALVRAVQGKPRDIDTPQSVYGAAEAGGQIAQAKQWSTYVLVLAGLNLMLGLINLVPLLPFDGGHIAVVVYERLRDLITRRKGGPVDYMKLAPLTYVVFAVLGAYMLLVLTADIVNPIKLFN